MSLTVLPTQIGFLPTGLNGVPRKSTFVIGRDINATISEGIGFGKQGRPDYVELININLTYNPPNSTSNSSATKVATISLDATGIHSIIASNKNVPNPLTFTLKEVSICETDGKGNSTEKRMVVLASDTYVTGNA